MFSGSLYIYEDDNISLKASSNPADHEFQRRMKVFKDESDVEASLKSGKFGVHASISNNKYFASFDWIDRLHLFRTFRLMRKMCIFKYYSVFALQKFSPYTELFSDYALRLV